MPQSPTAHLSVIIPTHNRLPKLLRLLRSIKAEFKGVPHETIVVDDGSTDETNLLKSGDVDGVTVIHVSNGGPARARNIGWNHSSSSTLVFLDDDCIVPPGYLNSLDDIIDHDWDVLGGGIRSVRESSLASSSLVRDFLSDLRHLEDPYYDESGRLRCLPSAHLLTRRSAMRALDGFDERFQMAGGEDNNLTQRALALGLPVEKTDSPWIYHEHVGSLRELASKFFDYGQGNALNCFLLKRDFKEAGLGARSWPELVAHIPRVIRNQMSAHDARKFRKNSRRWTYSLLLVILQLAYDAGGVAGVRKWPGKLTVT